MGYRMRILVVITSLGTGGAEMALFRLLSTLQPKGIEPLVVSLMAMQGEHFAALGVPYVSLDMPRATLNAQAVARLRQIVRAFRPDLVQGWMYHSNVVAHLARWFAPAPRPALALAIRSSLTQFAEKKRLTRWVIQLDAWLSRRAEQIFYVSRLGCLQHGDFGYARDHALVIPNGFNADIFKPSRAARVAIRQELQLPECARLIGHIASWQPVKNHVGFFRAAALLAERYPDVYFVCAGRGVTYSNPDVMAVIPDGLRSRLLLLGERGDIPQLNAALDVAVNASHAEGFPNVVGEAMACAVPCVVTDVGDSAWIVGVTGRVVPPDDSLALAQAVAEILDLPAADYLHLGQQARQRVVNDFSLEHVAQRYFEAWHELVSRRKV